VDGGPSDGTLEVLRSHSESYPQRVRFITGTDKNAEDGWHKGLLLSPGDILGWLGADGTYTPDPIRTVVEFFRINPGASFVFGVCNVVDESDQPITQRGTKDFDLEETLHGECPIPAPSTFYKREVIAQVGLLDMSFTPSDFDCWIRMARLFRIYRIKEVLANFRLHAGRISGSPRIQKRYAYVTYKTSQREGLARSIKAELAKGTNDEQWLLDRTQSDRHGWRRFPGPAGDAAACESGCESSVVQSSHGM
jgi:glycosyltransferase involved in cell wall biosynthesis